VIGEHNEQYSVSRRSDRRSQADRRALEDLSSDAVPDFNQLYRSRVAVGRDAIDLERVRCRSCAAGFDSQLVFLDLRVDADSRRHAGRSFQAADRDRVCDDFLGRVPGDRGSGHELAHAAADTTWIGGIGSADLSRRRQAQRDLDDADRTRSRSDAARRRCAARRRSGIDRDRLVDRGLQFLARGFPHRGYRHRAVRPVGLVLHPQLPRGRIRRSTKPKRATSNRRTRSKTPACRHRKAEAGWPTSDIVRPGACAWGGCSSTPPFMVC